MVIEGKVAPAGMPHSIALTFVEFRFPKPPERAVRFWSEGGQGWRYDQALIAVRASTIRFPLTYIPVDTRFFAEIDVPAAWIRLLGRIPHRRTFILVAGERYDTTPVPWYFRAASRLARARPPA